MFVLLDFSPIKPDVGLILWTTVIFALFWYLIGKWSFRPIANALKKREHDIQYALDEAKRARKEMAQLQAENEQLLNQAREERATMLLEAKETQNAIIAEARVKAKEEARKIVINAQQEIENQKKAAISEIKNKLGLMALDVAEKILRKELSTDPEQEKYAKALVDELNLN